MKITSKYYSKLNDYSTYPKYVLSTLILNFMIDDNVRIEGNSQTYFLKSRVKTMNTAMLKRIFETGEYPSQWNSPYLLPQETKILSPTVECSKCHKDTPVYHSHTSEKSWKYCPDCALEYGLIYDKTKELE